VEADEYGHTDDGEGREIRKRKRQVRSKDKTRDETVICTKLKLALSKLLGKLTTLLTRAAVTKSPASNLCHVMIC
jgi:hypothetical protein